MKLHPNWLSLGKFHTLARGASITLQEPEIVLKLPLVLQKAGIAVLPNSDRLRVADLLQVDGQPGFKDDPMKGILIIQVQKLFGRPSYLGLTSQIGPRP